MELECIYCMQTKSADMFNREHVLPEAFGGYEHARVLNGAVCEDCNSHFGRTIDLTLARGSEEGLQRYLHGIRPPNSISQFRYDSVSLEYAEGDDYEGALLRLVPDPQAPTGFRGEPHDQVGFAKSDGSGFRWFRLPAVYNGDWKSAEDIDWRKGVKIYAEDHEAVRTFLEGEGISHPKWRTMVRDSAPGSEVTVQQWAEITTDVKRVMAKIAFNFFAHVHGPEVARRPQFDRVRRYIRYGEEADFDLVETDLEEIFAPDTETPEGMRAAIHVVTVEQAVNAPAVIAQVQLFGGVRYQVVLSVEALKELVMCGVVYNPADRQIYELGNRRQA